MGVCDGGADWNRRWNLVVEGKGEDVEVRIGNRGLALRRTTPSTLLTLAAVGKY